MSLRLIKNWTHKMNIFKILALAVFAIGGSASAGWLTEYQKNELKNMLFNNYKRTDVNTDGNIAGIIAMIDSLKPKDENMINYQDLQIKILQKPSCFDESYLSYNCKNIVNFLNKTFLDNKEEILAKVQEEKKAEDRISAMHIVFDMGRIMSLSQLYGNEENNKTCCGYYDPKEAAYNISGFVGIRSEERLSRFMSDVENTFNIANYLIDQRKFQISEDEIAVEIYELYKKHFSPIECEVKNSMEEELKRLNNKIFFDLSETEIFDKGFISCLLESKKNKFKFLKSAQNEQFQ
ncbi:hypothetical protein [Candidatus Hydrogenosomobacter endosymbioticus]|uniref:Uncharacterized protein n=1 Tax=Candidatus Hydrogenosomobacter endosymbioticus TaxID=2558174 RepID=A0ABM7V848_9PROT|nr:hypothetical protein [Candidatus Hydrogenosomobacter endosymbioticus]BDB95935.1 hypothetical protein HYD_0680 [Candidatus Hydrogenosomobacter endosymbioticus]